MTYDEPLPRCTSLACLCPLDGQRVVVIGRLLAPGSGKGILRLRLGRHETIAIGHFDPQAGLQPADLAAYADQEIAITGRIVFGEIPEIYQVYQRIGDPYLVEVTAVRPAPG